MASCRSTESSERSALTAAAAQPRRSGPTPNDLKVLFGRLATCLGPERRREGLTAGASVCRLPRRRPWSWVRPALQLSAHQHRSQRAAVKHPRWAAPEQRPPTPAAEPSQERPVPVVVAVMSRRVEPITIVVDGLVAGWPQTLSRHAASRLTS